MSKTIERAPTDGPISVQWVGDELCISETHDGKESHIKLSPFNARRILGAMGMLLDLPLSKAAVKSIKM